MRGFGIAALIGYIATIFAANWLVVNVGIVNVGFGLQAPAAVYVVGLAFTLRDVVQRLLGRRIVVAAIVVGAILSLIVSTSFALASGAAFLVSEFADLAVYTPLSGRSWLGAVLLSNTVGLVIDSVLFLWLSPLPVRPLLAGQIVGKAWVTLATVAVLAAASAAWARRPQTA